MGRHIFLQKNNGLFVTVTKTKPSLYANYASDFYFIRKKIIQNYLELALKPLVVKLNNYFSPLRILDVGCGDGVVLNALKNIQEKLNIPLKLYGLDIDKEAINHAECKAIFSLSSATKMPYENNFFHLVVSSQTVEHLKESDIEKALSEIYRVLSPNGMVYIETPNPNSLIAKTMGRDWWMFLEEHSTLIAPSVLAKMLSKVGFIKSKGRTRTEIDWQIDEVREILKWHVPGLKYVPESRRYFVLKNFIKIFNKGGITTVTALKK